jgi:hypothetical protein
VTRKFLYDSSDTSDTVTRTKNLVGDDAEIIDVESWDDDQKRDFYFREIMPLSVQTEKNLGEDSDDRHAGFLDFEKGVLLTDDALYVGDEVLDYVE